MLPPHVLGRSLSAAGDRKALLYRLRRFSPSPVVIGVTLVLAPQLAATGDAPRAASTRHAVPVEHPRILGDTTRLQLLAKKQPEVYRRVREVARNDRADSHSRVISRALVAAIDEDAAIGRLAVDDVLRYVDGPIRKGHVPFGSDLALAGIAYDLCHDQWTDDERQRFHAYVGRTVDANRQSETHVFHNGWYGYKNWGIGIACYASYHENPRAPSILAGLEREFRERAGPALELAGCGGGWAEGYYVHYWLYEWLFFCEVARHTEGVDYYAMAPRFFRERAIASMFEMLPGLGEYGSRRPVPMGDGGGRVFGGDRDKALSARRILVNYYSDDREHQAVHAFNESTPRSSVGVYAYKDLLWRDTSVPHAELSDFQLSHASRGPGHVYARSSWEEDATYFFFKVTDRFTAHQHLDVGHFYIYRGGELAGDGGHYDGFGTPHDVNFHLRTIAHNTLLVHDPEERWPSIRAGDVTGNDGGQHHSWPHHNGAVTDAAAWTRRRELYDIADLLAFEDQGAFLYVAGDCTRAYSPRKLEHFTRQILFIRPGTFIVLDRVKSRDPKFRKTWLLHVVSPPEEAGQDLVVEGAGGKLFVSTLLPRSRNVSLKAADDLYRYDGQSFPPERDTGPAPRCRIEVSPSTARAEDLFLHVLTATAASLRENPHPERDVREHDGRVELDIGSAEVSFDRHGVSGEIEIGGHTRKFGP